MTEGATSPGEAVRPLKRVRQIREFTPQPVSDDEFAAIIEAARWSGSSSNSQPWRFVTIRNAETIHALADAYMPSSRALQTATAAIAILLPDDPDKAVMHAYDEGRVAERILIAAQFVGLAAAISWVWEQAQPTVKNLLGIPAGWRVRTVMAIGHPTEAARRPKSAPGTARKPSSETVISERWPDL